MIRVKYIRTKDNQIIIFSELLNHSDFSHKSPISAGFISIGVATVDGYSETTCNCYGESISLGLKSIPDEDTKLARRQILGYDF